MKLKIMRSLELGPNDTVVEIGPGFGELTLALAEAAKRVFAVEKDKNIARIFNSALEVPDNTTIIGQDFLDFDFNRAGKDRKIIVYGNLPYYVTSPIIEKIIDNADRIKIAYLVVQAEVAERIVARPGSPDIGRLSLYAQYHAEPEILFRIKRRCFYPVPEVESALLMLKVRKSKKVLVKDESVLFELIKRAYGQRRKTIINSLASVYEKEALMCAAREAAIDPSARPETLSLEHFARLADLLC